MKLDAIIQGDAEIVMREIPDRTIHLIVTSPPYNTGIPYDEHEDRLVYNEYLAKMRRILTECYRVLVRGGRIAVNLPSCTMQHNKSRVAYLSIDFLLLMRDIGFQDREFVTWLKNLQCQPAGRSTSWGSWCSASNPTLRDCSETILIMHKEAPKLDPNGVESDLTGEEFRQWTTNVWMMPPFTPMRKLHPAPFPFELPRRVIKLYSFPGQIVLDPFCGVGTTCIVAKQLNRRFIGIEKSRRYCKLARHFLSQNEFGWEFQEPVSSKEGT